VAHTGRARTSVSRHAPACRAQPCDPHALAAQEEETIEFVQCETHPRTFAYADTGAALEQGPCLMHMDMDMKSWYGLPCFGFGVVLCCRSVPCRSVLCRSDLSLGPVARTCRSDLYGVTDCRNQASSRGVVDQ